MKVAHIVCTFPPYKGGMGNSTYHFARVLSEAGYDITVFTPDYIWRLNPIRKRRQLAAEAEKVKNFKVARLWPLFSHGNAAVLPQLLWRLSGFDIVHLHYPFYGSTSLVLLRKLFSGKKMKLIVHYHMESVSRGLKGLIFRLNRLYVLPPLIKSARVVICSSLDYAKNSALSAFYGPLKEKFKKISFGVDLKRFIELKERPINNKDKTILFVGGLDRAHYFKGLENLIKAFERLSVDKELKKHGLAVKLNILGEGNLRAYYQGLVKDLGLEPAVSFFGQIKDKELVKFYNDCDVFVLPSINQGEAFGLVLLEALACSRPIIASNLPGVRSVFKNGREGLLVRPNDINDLVGRLKFILINDKLAKKMGRAGRKLVENKYAWEKIGRDLDLLYHYVKYTPE